MLVFELTLFVFIKDGKILEIVKEMRKQNTKQLQARCCICVDNGDEELVQCNKCMIFVHLSCYRSIDVCMDDGAWLCDWCQYVNGFDWKILRTQSQ